MFFFCSNMCSEMKEHSIEIIVILRLELKKIRRMPFVFNPIKKLTVCSFKSNERISFILTLKKREKV